MLSSALICPLSTALFGPHVVFCEYLLYRLLQRAGIATISIEIGVLFCIVLTILRLFYTHQLYELLVFLSFFFSLTTACLLFVRVVEVIVAFDHTP
jgi:hypothetical protein